MLNNVLLVSIWLVGSLLSYWMIKVEHESSNENYTNGDKALQIFLSLLSFAFVIFILIVAWVKSNSKYWNKPLKKKPE